MRVGLVQMNSVPEPATNLATLRSLLAGAAEQRPDLVVLPENFVALGGVLPQRAEIAEVPGDGPVQTSLSELAKQYDCWIVAGTIPMQSNDLSRPYSACLVFNSAGQQVARYDKIHLFDVEIAATGEVYSESAFTTAGSRPCMTETPWGRLGIAVCYDLRFPEQFRSMAAAGMDILAIPAAFTRATGADHWETLLRSRAIENQCAVIAAAQTGRHADGRRTWGHSLAVDAWGRVQLDMGDTPGLACVNMDLSAQHDLRREFPALKHRRNDIF